MTPSIPDAALNAAINAWCDTADVDEWRVRNTPEALRAALTAALPHLAAGEAVAKQEPVVIDAVATVAVDSEEGPYLDWLIEGGISDLAPGTVLMVSAVDLTNDEGYGEVYTTPAAQAPEGMGWQSFDSMPEAGEVLLETLTGHVRVDDVRSVRAMIASAKREDDACWYTRWQPLPRTAAMLAAAAQGDGA